MTATVRCVLWTVVYLFQRLELCVLCSGLSCTGFNYYKYAFCVMDNRVLFSTDTSMCSV